MWKKFLGHGVLAVVIVFSLGFAYLYFGSPATAPPSSVKIQPSEARLARGKYLFQHVAACGDCHSQRDYTHFGGPVIEGGEGLGFAFPQEMGFPGTVVAPIITPDRDAGIGKWSEQDFLNKFYQYRKYVEQGSPKIGPESFTLMPWLPFCQLPEEDLKAIFIFLKTQPAVYNAVETHPAELQPVKPVS